MDLIDRYMNPKRVLGFVCLVILGVVALRFYHLYLTGYMLPDEFFYYDVIILNHEPILGRELFSTIYSLFFAGARTLPSFLLMGAAYTSTWGLGTAFLFYEIGRRLKIPSDQHSIMLLSLLFLPVYIVMLPMLLTETMGLFFALLGILFAVRYYQSGGIIDALLSSISFVAAYKIREPYLLFGLANFIGILMSHKRNWRSAIAYFVPLLLMFPMPVSLWPPRVAELTPVYAYLIQWAQWTITPFIGPTAVTLTTAVTQTSAVTHTGVAPPTVPVNPLVVGVASRVGLSTYLYGLLIGFVFGYNPVFAVIGIVSLLLGIWMAWRKRSAMSSLPPWNGLVGLGAFAASVAVLIYPASGLIPFWTSTVIRASHISLPTVFTFPRTYERIGIKRSLGVLLIVLAASSVMLPVISQALQSNLNLWNRNAGQANVLSFSYRAPYYRLYQSAKSGGKTLVLGSLSIYATVYLSMLPNVQVSGVPGSETEFKAMLAEHWDTIILYGDDTCSITAASCLAGYAQYYREILASRLYEGFTVETLWVDPDSYGLKMTPLT